MKTRLVLSLLVVTLGACSTSPADLKPVNDLDATARTQLKDPGAPETAIATWDRAIAALQPSSDGYLANQLYVDRARYATDQALAELLWDHPQEARQRYLDALTVLHDDVERNTARAKAVNERIQTLGTIAGIGTSLVGSVVASNMHAPYYYRVMNCWPRAVARRSAGSRGTGAGGASAPPRGAGAGSRSTRDCAARGARAEPRGR